MDMSFHEGTIWQRMASDKGRTAISHFFRDELGVYLDIGAGLLIAGALAAWVPNHFWQAFFLQGHPILTKLWGPAVGPVVAILSFICSVGNVPLAAVLWNGGISFGGVVAFLFADLIGLGIFPLFDGKKGAEPCWDDVYLFLHARMREKATCLGHIVGPSITNSADTCPRKA